MSRPPVSKERGQNVSPPQKEVSCGQKPFWARNFPPNRFSLFRRHSSPCLPKNLSDETVSLFDRRKIAFFFPFFSKSQFFLLSPSPPPLKAFFFVSRAPSPSSPCGISQAVNVTFSLDKESQVRRYFLSSFHRFRPHGNFPTS